MARAEESFDFTITTASWLAEQPAPEKGFEFLQAVLLLSPLGLRHRGEGDQRPLRNTQGETWGEVATSLSRFGHWELADYRE